MRTEEISTNNASQKIEDLEKGDNAISPIAKIKNIFENIWNSVRRLFLAK
jgi:hypothetical protein